MCEVDDNFLLCESIENFEEAVKKKCVPTQTQVRQQLGSKLSDVFFENLSSEGKVWLGLEPALVGPDAVWINPEARLTKKVAVTPVPEPAIIRLKALTHKSVLEVGEEILILLENKHRLEVEEALKKQAKKLEEECRRQFADISSSHGDSAQCQKVVGVLMEHFDKCFTELVDTTKLRMRKECQLRIDEERAEIASYMLSQLQEEVERRDMELCIDFHDILYGELNILATRYIKQINKDRETAVQLLRETIQKYEKMLKDMKMEMEFNTIVDVCRAINQERVECNARIRKLQRENKANQDELLNFIDDLKDKNDTLQKMSTERLKRLMNWKKKVRLLLVEFQRFINFALKSVPGQAEFFLCAEKLMLKSHPEDTFVGPEDYENFKKCMAGKLDSEDDMEVLEEKPLEVPKALSLKESTSKDYEVTEYQGRTECIYNFDYYTFKSMLVKKFASNITRPKSPVKPKKAVCLWKKKSKESTIDKSSELYQMLTVIGESERQHVVPVNCFLRRRLNAVMKICEEDPEFAKIMLGCPGP